MKEITKKDLRQFGLVLGAVLCLIGYMHFRKGHTNVFTWFLGFGMFSLAVAVISPGVLRGPCKIFSKAAHGIGWFNTRLILILLYYLILTPVGLIRRLVGKDLLNRHIDRDARSYWVSKQETKDLAEDLEKQF